MMGLFFLVENEVNMNNQNQKRRNREKLYKDLGVNPKVVIKRGANILILPIKK